MIELKDYKSSRSVLERQELVVELLFHIRDILLGLKNGEVESKENCALITKPSYKTELKKESKKRGPRTRQKRKIL